MNTKASSVGVDKRVVRSGTVSCHFGKLRGIDVEICFSTFSSYMQVNDLSYLTHVDETAVSLGSECCYSSELWQRCEQHHIALSRPISGNKIIRSAATRSMVPDDARSGT